MGNVNKHQFHKLMYKVQSKYITENIFFETKIKPITSRFVFITAPIKLLDQFNIIIVHFYTWLFFFKRIKSPRGSRESICIKNKMWWKQWINLKTNQPKNEETSFTPSSSQSWVPHFSSLAWDPYLFTIYLEDKWSCSSKWFPYTLDRCVSTLTTQFSVLFMFHTKILR